MNIEETGIKVIAGENHLDPYPATEHFLRRGGIDRRKS